ncbi:MAG: F-type H+-transporting ATPase subunit a [Actinomycetota bacterium]|jgi:F-type H+-transporting ATPase subunit a|nr:F-type H+-transporting ATPase subunit a [Actinomycetota bacterium]
MTHLLAIEFPPIAHVIEWRDLLFKGTPFAVNKVVILMWLTVAIAFTFFYVGSRAPKLVPAGVQNIAESAVDFIRTGVILQTMGPDGLPWTPFLLTLFTWIFVGNIWEIIPGAQMPTNARIAFPALMAITVWVLYHYVGIKTQGLLQYLKGNMFMPGVPKAMYVLVTPIETVTFLITQPLSLAVRLFANMLAGHLLLVSFATITAAVWSLSPTIVIWPFSFGLLVGLTAFEILVAFLQAFIFVMLTGVYIGKSMHPEH